VPRASDLKQRNRMSRADAALLTRLRRP
jgi:hypothetical protein